MVSTLKYAFIVCLGVISVVASPATTTERVCETHITAKDVITAEAHFQANRLTHKRNRDVHQTTSTLNVFWHIIAKDTTPSGGYIPDAQIADAISVLNNAFTRMGIHFTLSEIDRTVNPDWFRISGTNSDGQHAMKNALRKGGAADLNVYTVGSIGGSRGIRLLGYSTLPHEYEGAPANDGVVVLFTTLPGGTFEPFNLGHILTHHTGHWVGLYDTFQGGCSEPGDYVDDTPAEASAATGCQIGRDTCPGSGVDPVQNFMDTSDDACMTGFTNGQGERAREQITLYRGVDF